MIKSKAELDEVYVGAMLKVYAAVIFLLNRPMMPN